MNHQMPGMGMHQHPPFSMVGAKWGQFPSCHMCLKMITDSRDVPVRDEDALISVVIRMAAFPGSRLATRPPRAARLCRPCYDHLKRVKESLVSKSLLDRVRLLVGPWWAAPGSAPHGGPTRPHSPPLCPGFVDTDVDPNIRRRLIRSLNADCVRRVENTISEYVELNVQLHRKIEAERLAEEEEEERRKETEEAAGDDETAAAPATSAHTDENPQTAGDDQAPTPRVTTPPPPAESSVVKNEPSLDRERSRDTTAAESAKKKSSSSSASTANKAKPAAAKGKSPLPRYDPNSLSSANRRPATLSSGASNSAPAPLRHQQVHQIVRPQPQYAVPSALLSQQSIDSNRRPMSLPQRRGPVTTQQQQQQQHEQLQHAAYHYGGGGAMMLATSPNDIMAAPHLAGHPPPPPPPLSNMQQPQYSPRSTLQYSPRSTMASSPRNTLRRDTLSSEYGDDDGYKQSFQYPSPAAIQAAFAAHHVALQSRSSSTPAQNEDDTAAAAALLGHLATSSYVSQTGQRRIVQQTDPNGNSSTTTI